MDNVPNDTGAERSSLAPRGSGEITLRPQSLIRRGLESLAKQEARTIEFPDHYTLGKLLVGDRSTLEGSFIYPYSKAGHRWKRLDATGRIVLLQNEGAVLFHETQLGNLESLRHLDRDALWGVSAGDRAMDNLAGLTGLRFLQLFSTSPSGFGSAHLHRLTNIRAFRLYGVVRPLSDSWLRALPTLPDLVDVNIHDSHHRDSPGGLSEDGLAELGSLVELRSLILSGIGPLNERATAFISKLTKLENLHLSGELVTDAALDPLADCTKLEGLHLADPAVTDNGLMWLATNLQSLKRLEVNFTYGDSKITNSGLEHISRMSNLSQLTWRVPNTTNEGVAHLRGLEGLESLSLEGAPRGADPDVWRTFGWELEAQITDSALAHLEGLSNLRSLSLRRTKVEGFGLQKLIGLPWLEELVLDENDLNESDLDNLVALVNLRRLSLRSIGLRSTEHEGPVFQFLRNIPWLEELALDNNFYVSDFDLTPISALTNLRKLSLRNTKVEGSGLQHLRGLTRLEELILDDTSVTGTDLRHISSLTNLRRLTLRNTNVTEDDLTVLDTLTQLERPIPLVHN